MAPKKERSPLLKIILILVNILLVFFIVVVCVAAGKYAFNWGYNNVLDNGGDEQLNKGKKIEFIIEENDTTEDIAKALKEKNLIKYPILFKTVSKISGNDKKYVDGKHILYSNMEYEDIMLELKRGKSTTDIAEREVTKITIPEGYDIEQIAEYLTKVKLVDKDKFLQLVNSDKFEYPFLDYEEIKSKKGRQYLLEGYLYPDTYEVYVDSKEEEIIKKMLNQFNNKFKDEYYKRAEELGLTVDEIVTLASIIEEEAMLDEERPRVSAVFHNRLKSKSYPMLESCATIQYILEERVDVILDKHKEIDSPYNTYMYSGLPVGPISSPGEQSLKAALYPLENCNDKFFVVNENGEHIFSETFEQHINAVNRINNQ